MERIRKTVIAIPMYTIVRVRKIGKLMSESKIRGTLEQLTEYFRIEMGADTEFASIVDLEQKVNQFLAKKNFGKTHKQEYVYNKNRESRFKDTKFTPMKEETFDEEL